MKNIKSIQTLTPEQWQSVADDLMNVAPALQAGLELSMKDHPELIETAFDPSVFEANVCAAITAIFYVVAFGSDKCKFAIVEHIEGAENMTAQELREALKAAENRT